MSVTFGVVGERCHCGEYCDECFKQNMNLANVNASGLLEWLGLPYDDLWGQVRAIDLKKTIELTLSNGQQDPGVPSTTVGNITDCGRRPGYFNEKAQQLLVLCERAGDLGVISWG